MLEGCTVIATVGCISYKSYALSIWDSNVEIAICEAEEFPDQG